MGAQEWLIIFSGCFGSPAAHDLMPPAGGWYMICNCYCDIFQVKNACFIPILKEINIYILDANVLSSDTVS